MLKTLKSIAILAIVSPLVVLGQDYCFPSHMPPGGKSPNDVKQYIVFDFDDNAYSGLTGTQFEANPLAAGVNPDSSWSHSGFVGMKSSKCGLTINEGDMGLSWVAHALAGIDISNLKPAWNASIAYLGGVQVTYNGKIYESSYWTQGDIPTSGGPWIDKGVAETANITKTNPDGSPIKFSFSYIAGLFVPTWGDSWESRESKYGYFKPSASESALHTRIASSWGREMQIGNAEGGSEIQPSYAFEGAKQVIAAGHEIGNHTIDHMESNSPLPGGTEITTWNVDMGFGRWDNEGYCNTNENVTPWGTYLETEMYGQPIGHTAQKRGWVHMAGRHISKKAWKGAIGLAHEEINNYLGNIPGYKEPVGFRAPRLEINSGGLFALKELGYHYDCSIEAGYETNVDGTNIIWPFTMDNGLPDKAYQIAIGYGEANETDKTHGYPYDSAPAGFWEMPVQVVIVPENNRESVWSNHAKIRSASPDGEFVNSEDSIASHDSFIGDGKITGFDFNLFILWGMTKENWLATMKNSINLRAEGGKAPLLYGAHTDYYAPIYDHAVLLSDFNKLSYGLNITEGWNTWQTRKEAMVEFRDWAIADKDCHFVTMSHLIEEMKSMQQNEVVGVEKDFSVEWTFDGGDLGTSSSVSSFLGNVSDAKISFKKKSGDEYPYASYKTVHSAGFLTGLTHFSLDYKTEAPIAVQFETASGLIHEVILTNLGPKVSSGKVPLHAFKSQMFEPDTANLDLNTITFINIVLLNGGNSDEDKTFSISNFKVYGASLDGVPITVANNITAFPISLRSMTSKSINLNISSTGKYSIEVISSNGKLVRSFNNLEFKKGLNAVNMQSRLSKGIYLIQIKELGISKALKVTSLKAMIL